MDSEVVLPADNSPPADNVPALDRIGVAMVIPELAETLVPEEPTEI